MRIARFLLPAVLLPLGLSAVQTGVIVDEGYASFFRGELTNVSLSRMGELGTAPKLTEVTSLKEGHVWNVVSDGEGGFAIGTGPSGKVLHLDAEGELETLFSSDRPFTRALAYDSDGNLYVGTAPGGAVFRVPAGGGKAQLFYDPEAMYIWDLAVEDGALWITTGTPAQLLRLPLDEETDEAEVWFAPKDENLKGLVRRDDEWLVGSAPRGIVYAVSEKDQARALFKADEEEIRAIATEADGSLLVSTFSTESRGGDPDSGELPPLVVNASGRSSSRAGGSLGDSSGKGYLIRIDPQGIARAEWRSGEGGIFALAPVKDRLWLLGFNQDGKLYGFSERNDWELLQQMPRGGEISAIEPLADGDGFFIFTSNPGVVYRLGGRSDADCKYESRVLAARQAVTWGRLETVFSAAGDVAVETRTGLTDEPDPTWSDWTPLEGEQIASPRGRYLQYRLAFPADSKARFLRARAFYSMPNAAPVISEIKVLGFGAELRIAQMNGQMFDFAAAFNESQMEKMEMGLADRMKLERRPEQTMRTLVWRAGDTNGDALTYDVYLRLATESNWTVLARELTDPVYLFNAAGFEPGEYQFKVVASDAPSNAYDQVLTATLTSALVLLDTTPPVLQSLPLEEGGRSIGFEAQGEDSRIVAAQVSIDGGEAISLRPVDGIFDSPTEQFRYRLDKAATAGLSVLFEVLDESGNQAALPVTIGAQQ